MTSVPRNTTHFCDLCDKDMKFEPIHYPTGEVKLECIATHFKCQCGAGYSNKAHFESHKEVHKIQTTWKGIDFEFSTDPQNLIDYEQREADECEKHAKKGIMYGSACYTDFVCCCDGLLEEFEQGKTVEIALHKCAIEGYDMDSFGYQLSKAELEAHHKFSHENDWVCRHECDECDHPNLKLWFSDNGANGVLWNLEKWDKTLECDECHTIGAYYIVNEKYKIGACLEHLNNSGNCGEGKLYKKIETVYTDSLEGINPQ